MEAKKGAATLLGCYRTGDANDPETYISAVVSVLARYSAEIIDEVTNPVSGLPSRLKWLPTIAEVREECDILANRERRRVEREKQIREQLEARDRLQITDQRPRKTYDQIVQECRAIGLNIGPKETARPLDPEAARKMLGLSKEAWDALPDAKGE